MDDATGHYSNGFLYGNNYWTGSMSLCTSIYKDEDNVFEDDNKPSGNGGFSINKHHDSTSQTAQIQHENPPFRPGFFVLTLNINETDIAPTVIKSQDHVNCNCYTIIHFSQDKFTLDCAYRHHVLWITLRI